MQTDVHPVERTCYPAIRHADGDVIKVRDCVLVKSGPKCTDIPFVAKIAALWDVNGNVGSSSSDSGVLININDRFRCRKEDDGDPVVLPARADRLRAHAQDGRERDLRVTSP